MDMACLRPFMLKNGGQASMPVPCGKCPNCRLSRAQGWIFRLSQEQRRSDSSHFVTLTYDGLPKECLTPNNFPTLFKSHLQLYFKTLRNDHYRDFGAVPRIKYFACGEYGGKTHRPHYHLILFNSATALIDRAWRDSSGFSRGFVHLGNVRPNSIAYCTKYMCKPGTVGRHDRDDRAREFSLMSKGLGSNYLTDQMVAYHQADPLRNFVVEPGGVKVAMPRYYRNAIFSEGDREYQQAVIADSKVSGFLDSFRVFQKAYPHATWDDFQRSTSEAIDFKLETAFSKAQKSRSIV